MEAPHSLVRCKCQHCSGLIEFDIVGTGTQVACPHCGLDTVLFVTKATVKAMAVESPKLVAKSTILCSYILSLLMPFAGFFAGIYLMAKRQSGHGVICMALSILMFLVVLAIFNL